MKSIVRTIITAAIVLIGFHSALAQDSVMSEPTMRKWFTWQPYVGDSARMPHAKVTAKKREQRATDSLGHIGDTLPTVRFTSIDRYWEKYRAWTPYQYAANNPLVWSDPSGDTIVYELAANTPQRYMDVTKEYMKMLRDAGGLAGRLVTQLENSTNRHVIRVTSAVLAQSSNNDREDAQNGTGTGTIITFNPFFKERSMEQKLPYADQNGPNFIILGHELGHSASADQGTALYDQRMPGIAADRVFPVAEEIWNTAYIENGIRSQFGLPTRTMYGPVRIYTPRSVLGK